MHYKRLSLLAIILALTSFLSGCGGSGSSPSVSVTASASTVDGTDSTTLTATVTNDKNSGGVTWSVSGGGTLSSQTASSATYTAAAATSSAQTITVTATSVADTTKTGTATITVPAAPSITTTSASLASSVGAGYAVTLAGSGGISPYTWALTSGSLPACVTMTTAGVISGTITATCAGTYTPTFKMTDSGKATALTASVQLTMVIASATQISFTGTAPSTGTYKVAYSGSAAATGGAGTLTYALTTGSTLPTGVTLNAATGAISGTPTTVGTYSFAVTASDAFGDTATSATHSLVISYPAMQITTSTLPAGYVGSVYTSTTLAATGGAGVSSNYTWAVASGSALPAGLSLSAAGVVSGTPSGSAGTTSVTFTVTDATSSLSANAALSIQIKAGVAITAATLPTGYVGSAYSGTQLAATGGTGSYPTWALASGSSLPAGLTLSTSGLISGTPSGSAGTTNFTVQVTDSTSNTATAGFSITISAGVTITTPTSLTDGYPNTAYSAVTLAAAGGTGTYTSWTVTSGAVPTGMTLSTAGVLSGTPTTAGNYSFVVKVTDSASNTATATFTLTVEGTLTISTTTLPSAASGAAYAQTLVATGGSGGNTWSVSTTATNTLSAYNLSLASNGQLTGTPGATGTADFTAIVTDSAGHTASQALSIVVSNMTISTSTLNYGVVGTAYSQTLSAVGGSGTYTWTVTAGSSNLAALGLTVTSAGVLTSNGTALTTTGSAGFTVQVKDSNNATATASYSVYVYAALAFTTTSLNAAVYNANYSAMIQTSGGSGNYTWKVNGASIPSTATATALTSGGGLTGLSSGGAALQIGGIPTSYGTITLAVQITDALTGFSASKTYTITVSSLTVSVDANSVPQGMVNMPYTFGNVAISNGSGPFTVTYTNAPAGLAGNSNNQLVGAPTSSGTTTVTVKVTDSSSPTNQVGTATFSLPVIDQTVGTANSKLNGQYACYLDRYWTGGVTGGDGTSTLYRGGALFAFTASGGTITGGEIDANSPVSGYKQASITGTYAIGADNRGYINIGSGSLILSVAGSNVSSNVFQELALTEMDDAGSSPSGQSGAGHCYKQVTTALSGIRPSGGYVFGLYGESMHGNTEAVVGQVVFSGSAATGVQDMVTGAGTPANDTFSNTTTTTDSFGRLVMQTSGVNNSVFYVTNNTRGDALIMTTSGHNGSNNADFMIGQARAQSSTNIAATYPITGPAVMYLNGAVNVSGSSPTYKAMAMQLTGGTSAKQVTINSIVQNRAGTFSLDTEMYGQTMTYTTDTSTGRIIWSGTTGDYLYLYDTNAAVVLLADTGNGGGTNNLIGWLEPQTTSGSWSLSEVATSSMMYRQPDGSYNGSLNDGVLTTGSDGTISNFAQDNGGWYWASWGEGLSGNSAVTATGALALNSTDGASYGLFDINMTSAGTTSTQVECYAISVDAAVKSTTKAKMVCLDKSSTQGSMSIVQE